MLKAHSVCGNKCLVHQCNEFAAEHVLQHLLLK